MARKKEKKHVSVGIAHIKSSFNNTIIAITDPGGNVLSWASAGNVGFKGSRKSTPYAAQMAAEKAARGAMEHGVRRVEVQVKGPGSGRETAIRSIQNAGIEVTGGCRRLKEGEEPQGLTVYRRQAPLLRTLTVTNQRSQNFYAESLLKTLGREQAGRGTWLAGAKQVRGFALKAGAPAEHVIVSDGSGLSRENRLSARALAAVLTHMQRSPHAQVYRDSLAQPGGDGTLKRRLKGLPADVTVRAKTGTLTGVSALSGYLEVNGKTLVFALIGNGGGTSTIRGAMDAVVTRVANQYAN